MVRGRFFCVGPTAKAGVYGVGAVFSSPRRIVASQRPVRLSRLGFGLSSRPVIPSLRRIIPSERPDLPSRRPVGLSRRPNVPSLSAVVPSAGGKVVSRRVNVGSPGRERSPRGRIGAYFAGGRGYLVSGCGYFAGGCSYFAGGGGDSLPVLRAKRRAMPSRAVSRAAPLPLARV